MEKIIRFIENNGWDFIENLRKQTLSIQQISNLKKNFPAFPINEILSLIKIQNKAKNKSKNARRLLFTQKSLEQSSTETLAIYHFEKFYRYSRIADLCCGSGMDLLHIAKEKEKFYAVDLDYTTLKMAKFNCNSLSLKNGTFLNLDVSDFDQSVDAVFIDPDRRFDGKRKIQIDDLSPNWQTLKKIILRYKNTAIKLSPAMNYENINLPIPWTLEFVSENRALKELLLCTGDLADIESKIKAVILPSKMEITSNQQSRNIIHKISKYLYEPDPAIIRGHLIQKLAFQFSLNKVSDKLAILTSEEVRYHSFFQTFKVISIIPQNLKKIKHFIKNNDIGRLDIKTRGFSEPVEVFRKKLKLKGNQHFTLFLLRLDKERCAVFCHNLSEKKKLWNQ